VNHLPTYTTAPDVALIATIEWAADGHGALYLADRAVAGHVAATYIPTDGSPLVDLHGLLGQQPEQVSWLLAP